MAEIPYRYLSLSEAAAFLPFSAGYIQQVLSWRLGRRCKREFSADANSEIPPFRRICGRWRIWGPTLRLWIDSRERRLHATSSFIPRATRTPVTRTVGAVFSGGYV